jgi:hypothetical protein
MDYHSKYLKYKQKYLNFKLKYFTDLFTDTGTDDNCQRHYCIDTFKTTGLGYFNKNKICNLQQNLTKEQCKSMAMKEKELTVNHLKKLGNAKNVQLAEKLKLESNERYKLNQILRSKKSIFPLENI